MKLEGKVAIVAGGGQGIGEGIVRCLAEEGANIALVDINSETAEKISDEVKSMGRKALPVVADLTDDAQLTRSVQDVVDFFGKIDILVNNVGGSSVETGLLMQEYRESLGDDTLPTFLYNSPEIWDRFYTLNLKTHVMLSHAVTPFFIKQKSGKIVNISSDAGRLPSPTQMPYGAMKAGDISITWSLARALAPYNVTVNCVCPGFVYSPLWARGATGQYNAILEAQAKGQLPERYNRFAAENIEGLTPYEFWMKYIVLPNTPMGREQTAEDMGRAVVFFVSEDAKNVTGQVLHIDGGMVMR
ncbi:MAG TPA: SDR family oxidoreductase [Dehalococcoidia bacterium]|nr:SDR family oxidoreductase [Dehalococcoidia bacterium]